MMKSTHSDQPKEEHGSLASYVTGFILSLLFTAIPYYLVVNKTVSSNLLLPTIIGIAVLQMVIQIFFFLHLGRGPKPLYNIIFFGATVATILLVVVGSMWIMRHLNYNMTPSDMSKKLIQKEGIYQIDGEKTGACQGQYINHRVTIDDSEVTPLQTEASLCDTLTFINEDDKVREITFGSHPEHGTYAGETELEVHKGRPKTLTLNQSGTYQFHDHLEPAVSGSFKVGPAH